MLSDEDLVGVRRTLIARIVGACGTLDTINAEIERHGRPER
jgi:hypothetical protein